MNETVKLITRKPPAGPTAIPEELEEHLRAEGYRWSWQPDRDDWMSFMYGNGIVPLLAQDIKDKAPELYAKVIDPGEAGTKRLIVVPDTGRIKMGDCILTIQRAELYDQMTEEWQERMSQMQNVLSNQEDDAEVMAAAMRTLGIPAAAKTATRSLDDIYRSLLQDAEG